MNIGRVKQKSAFEHSQHAQIQIILRMRKVYPGISSQFMHSVLSIDSVSDSEGPDQTARKRRLIWAFTVRKCPKTRIRMTQSLYDCR